MYDVGIPLQQVFFYSMPMERDWLSVSVSNCHKFNFLAVTRQTQHVEFKLKDILFAWEWLGWYQPLQLPTKNCANQDCIVKKKGRQENFSLLHLSTAEHTWWRRRQPIQINRKATMRTPHSVYCALSHCLHAPGAAPPASRLPVILSCFSLLTNHHLQQS